MIYIQERQDLMASGDSRRIFNANYLINRMLHRPRRLVMDSSQPLIEFPDVSYYQGNIDWDTMKRQTNNVIVRAGQNTWKDEKFLTNWPAAKQRSMSRGCYWFYDGRASPQDQWNALRPLIINDPPEDVIWMDWERNYGGAHEGLKNVVAMMQLIQAGIPGCTVGMYTAYYFFTANSNSVANANQYAWLAENSPAWIAHWGVPSDQILIPPPWTEETTELHQFGTPSVGHQYGCESIELDMNRVVNNHQRYQESAPPTGDTITTPFTGVTRTVGRRFNSQIYISVIDHTKARFEVAHEKPFVNGLFFVSLKCVEKNAQLGVNGDEWDKNFPLPAFPKNSAWSNGSLYVERTQPVPSLNIRSDGVPEIKHVKNDAEHNETSGLRYLLENGVIKDYLYGSEIQYTERHPRGVTGLTADKHVILLTVDGRTNASTGVTLLEAANIMKEFGAVTAYDRGGGGDAVDVMNGIVQNIPSDVHADGTPGKERAVPQSILVYAKKETTMQIIQGEALGTVKRRKAPQGLEYVPPRYLLKGDKIEASENSNQWLHLTKINGVVVTDEEWASAGSTQQYISWRWVEIEEPPPPDTNLTHVIEVFDDGSIKIDGNPYP